MKFEGFSKLFSSSRIPDSTSRGCHHGATACPTLWSACQKTPTWAWAKKMTPAQWTFCCRLAMISTLCRKSFLTEATVKAFYYLIWKFFVSIDCLMLFSQITLNLARLNKMKMENCDKTSKTNQNRKLIEYCTKQKKIIWKYFIC